MEFGALSYFLLRAPCGTLSPPPHCWADLVLYETGYYSERWMNFILSLNIYVSLWSNISSWLWGVFSPNYRKYTISYLSILFNNSASRFWGAVYPRLLRTLLVSQSPPECHSGIYKGLHCTEDIATLRARVACPLSLITLGDPGLAIRASSFCCLLPAWNSLLYRKPAVHSWKQFIRFLSGEIQFHLIWWVQWYFLR